MSQKLAFTKMHGLGNDFVVLDAAHPALAGLDRERSATQGLVAPLHPAAEAYFRGAGLVR